MQRLNLFIHVRGFLHSMFATQRSLGLKQGMNKQHSSIKQSNKAQSLQLDPSIQLSLAKSSQTLTAQQSAGQTAPTLDAATANIYQWHI
ncbi:hypothetical protein EC844_1023 [Acinetobacter calcoaceticus]|uniref:Uncharacterized protein n=1 Tax=Acinetobacter calcoaceticus TaxID=471 RepID=A0A4R1XYE8_ACICA|nr:hypothetical protein EC844_1023 [Acinetobacter calcoaceticus]